MQTGSAVKWWWYRQSLLPVARVRQVTSEEDETMGILCMFLTRSGQYQLYCSAEILTLLTEVIIGLNDLFSLLLGRSDLHRL